MSSSDATSTGPDAWYWSLAEFCVRPHHAAPAGGSAECHHRADQQGFADRFCGGGGIFFLLDDLGVIAENRPWGSVPHSGPELVTRLQIAAALGACAVGFSRMSDSPSILFPRYACRGSGCRVASEPRLPWVHGCRRFVPSRDAAPIEQAVIVTSARWGQRRATLRR